MVERSRTSGVATVNGARLVWESAGTGRTIVLIHAGICDRRMWEPQFDRYAAHARVIRYDMRGFGDSPMVPGEFSHPADLLALLDDIGVETATLIGASMGGRTALDLALDHLDRVDAVVTVGSTPRGFTMDDAGLTEAWREADEAFERGDLDRVNEIELRIWVDGPHRIPGDVDPDLRAKVGAMNRRALQLESEVEGDEREPARTANDHLAELTMPVLAIVGSLDRIGAIEGSRRIAAHVAQGRFAEVPDTAHLPSLERPDAFDDLVLPFLRA